MAGEIRQAVKLEMFPLLPVIPGSSASSDSMKSSLISSSDAQNVQENLVLFHFKFLNNLPSNSNQYKV